MVIRGVFMDFRVSSFSNAKSLDDITEIHRSSIMIELSILVLHDEIDGLIILGALACSLCFCLLFVFRFFVSFS